MKWATTGSLCCEWFIGASCLTRFAQGLSLWRFRTASSFFREAQIAHMGSLNFCTFKAWLMPEILVVCRHQHDMMLHNVSCLLINYCVALLARSNRFCRRNSFLIGMRHIEPHYILRHVMFATCFRPRTEVTIITSSQNLAVHVKSDWRKNFRNFLSPTMEKPLLIMSATFSDVNDKSISLHGRQKPRKPSHFNSHLIFIDV